MHQYRLGHTSWKTALCKRTWSSDRQQFEHESELYHCGRKQPWTVLRKAASKAKLLTFLSAQVWWDTSGALCPVLGFFKGKKDVHTLERVQQRATRMV